MTTTRTDTLTMIGLAWQHEPCARDSRSAESRRERFRSGGMALSYCTLKSSYHLDDDQRGMCLTCKIRNQITAIDFRLISEENIKGVPLLTLFKEADERGCSKNERRDCFQRKDGDPCVYCRTGRLLIAMEDSDA